jgi:hypothetical protein
MRRQKFSADILKNSTKIGICNVSSDFALNLDGTGFSGSKSSRTESSKVIMPNSFLKTPIFKGKVDLHFVRALCEISAAGEVLAPGLITTPETEHSDSVQCSYSPNAPIGAIPKAVVRRQIVSGRLRTAIVFMLCLLLLFSFCMMFVDIGEDQKTMRVGLSAELLRQLEQQ